MAEDHKSTAFSSVVLTLVSIVVALAIEQLLSHVAAQLGTASGSTTLFILGQGVVLFLVAGAIWTVYATMVMTGSWEPRFQDFFAPLIILALLFIGIRAIGRSDAVWFSVAAAGWANALLGQRIALPPELAERLKPSSTRAWRAHGTNLVLCLLATFGAIASLLRLLTETVGLILICVLALGQLLATWFHFRWWRAA